MVNESITNEYFDFVINLFFSDTITLLDLVLFDDETAPEYSAVMAYNRFFAYLKLTSDSGDSSADNQIQELLIESGYNEADIRRFMKRKRAEESYYHGTVFS